MMDSEKLKKRQSFKVIASEAVMVLAVIIMVAVLALIVSGYWVNSDFKVERQGMIQVSSIPTGADLDIDGESSWLQRTNTSKVLPSGQHTVTLSKEGYDSWSKQINISEGLLYRLHYPRLFLEERESAKVLDTSNFGSATIAPNRNKLLLINDTTEWELVNINNDTLEPKKLNIAPYFSSVSLAEGATKGLFTGKILLADWDRSSDHVLFKVENTDNIEWVLIDVENVKNSINLSKEFGANFTAVEILDNSSNNLLVVRDGHLHKIDIPGKAVSNVLADHVVDFDHYENEIIYASQNTDNKYSVNLFKIGNDEITKLESTTTSPRVAISKFYDEMYITILKDDVASLYKKNDFTPVADYNLSFIPHQVKVGHNGEFIIMSTGTQLATLDMEASAVIEWRPEGESFGWLDNDMIYSVADGKLIVYDFDGFNRRVLAGNVSSHFPTTVTDDKWLYYFSDGNLIRELITR